MENEKGKKTETVPVADDLRREDVEVPSLNSHEKMISSSSCCCSSLSLSFSVYVYVESLQRDDIYTYLILFRGRGEKGKRDEEPNKRHAIDVARACGWVY